MRSIINLLDVSRIQGQSGVPYRLSTIQLTLQAHTAYTLLYSAGRMSEVVQEVRIILVRADEIAGLEVGISRSWTLEAEDR